MHIKDLCKEAHKTAIEKGFWPEDKSKRNISEMLMLVVTELAEACEALRKSGRQKLYLVKGGASRSINWEKDTFEDEIADTFIRLGDLCEALGIDIEWQIKEKMNYNKTRPKLHGKKF